MLMLISDVNVLFIDLNTSKQQKAFSITANHQRIPEESNMFVAFLFYVNKIFIKRFLLCLIFFFFFFS